MVVDVQTGHPRYLSRTTPKDRDRPEGRPWFVIFAASAPYGLLTSEPYAASGTLGFSHRSLCDL
ncbi:hypothetical protein CLV80_103212 [Yoonia maritima]|uniref:Uncharacterized protein n=1 Tax=Yoonia maritima TaxID=1435347 RepID=A0A2T0W252_9RHOB|nr:hypothetical protein CLV80_103212 [Yoonia maritima]